MTINNASEAAKAVVRRNTEEVQGGGSSRGRVCFTETVARVGCASSCWGQTLGRTKGRPLWSSDDRTQRGPAAERLGFGAPHLGVDRAVGDRGRELLIGQPRELVQRHPTLRQKRRMRRLCQPLVARDRHQSLNRPRPERQLVLDHLLELPVFRGDRRRGEVARLDSVHPRHQW